MNVSQERLHDGITKPASYRAYGPVKTFLRVFEQLVAFNSHLSWQIQAHFLWLLCYGMEVSLDSLLLSPVSSGPAKETGGSLFVRLWVSVAPSCTVHTRELVPCLLAWRTAITALVKVSCQSFILLLWLCCDHLRASVSSQRAKEGSIDPRPRDVFMHPECLSSRA